jgi:hypothetical protein
MNPLIFIKENTLTSCILSCTCQTKHHLEKQPPLNCEKVLRCHDLLVACPRWSTTAKAEGSMVHDICLDLVPELRLTAVKYDHPAGEASAGTTQRCHVSQDPSHFQQFAGFGGVWSCEREKVKDGR